MTAAARRPPIFPVDWQDERSIARAFRYLVRTHVLSRYGDGMPIGPWQVAAVRAVELIEARAYRALKIPIGHPFRIRCKQDANSALARVLHANTRIDVAIVGVHAWYPIARVDVLRTEVRA